MATECLEHCPIIKAQQWLIAYKDTNPKATEFLVESVTRTEECDGPVNARVETINILRVPVRRYTVYDCGLFEDKQRNKSNY